MAATLVSHGQSFSRIAHRLGLSGDTYATKRSLAPLISSLCGIRGDRMDQAHLVLAARLPRYTPTVLLRELQEKHSVVRTWGVRGVLQIVPTPELGEYLSAAGAAPRWRRFLEGKTTLAAPARLRLLKRICPEVVSRDALREAFPDASMRLFILREAAQAGHIVWAEGDGSAATFVWTKALLGKVIHPERNFQELVGRYLAAYGPLGAADLGSWIGVTVAAARQLMAKHRVVEIQVEGEDHVTFMRPEDLDELQATRKSTVRGVVIIPPGDPLVIAYKLRWRSGEASDDGPGLGFVDGRLVATWTLVRNEALVQLKDPEDKSKILKGITNLLSRAGVEATVKLES